MHASKIFFTSLSMLAGLAAGEDQCCNSGTADIDDFCTSQSTLDHQVCDNTNPNKGRGCDRDTNFPIGQQISEPSTLSCTSGGATGFLACSL
ncbi:hypothetical protein CGRA01v4_12252 [Colletotrichum graminicola]|nr:hypothetical protein CGRA01v4_12252 [Colletotrichum graminicola]